MLKRLIRRDDNFVFAYDEAGNKIEDLEGILDGNLKRKLYSFVNTETIFQIDDWTESRKVSAVEFFNV